MSSSLVFITGATGFIGSQVALKVLEAGYKLRISIRRENQGEKLRQVFSQYADQLDFAIVPDLTAPGCFDKTLDGVEYVLHLASPLAGAGDDLLTPAVRGTVSILESAAKVPSVKRVVITASVLSLMPLNASREGLVVKS